MMKIDQDQVREELLTLFRLFLKNPDRNSCKVEAKLLSQKYTGLISYSKHSVKEVVSQELLDALNSVDDIVQYGAFDDNHPAFSKAKIMQNITRIVNGLTNT